MAERAIQVGDRVVHLQVPGVFTVMSRQGSLLVVESPRGLRMTMLEKAARRLDDPPPAPADA
jgi:hypothetical protein